MLLVWGSRGLSPGYSVTSPEKLGNQPRAQVASLISYVSISGEEIQGAKLLTLLLGRRTSVYFFLITVIQL